MLAGGVLFAVGNALHPLEHNDAAYDSATWEAAHLVILASIPLLVLGLPAVEAKLRSRLGGTPLASWPIVASIVGLIGLAPGMVLEAFVAPSVGHQAMTELEGGGMGVVNGMFGVGFLGGALALAWAVRKARVGPRWAPYALGVAVLALFGVMGATGPAAGVVIITGTVVYGLVLAVLGRR
jgi:hypothetical protein